MSTFPHGKIDYLAIFPVISSLISRDLLATPDWLESGPEFTVHVERLFDVFAGCLSDIGRVMVLIIGDFNFPGINWVALDADLTGSKFLDLTQDCFLIQHVLKPTRYDNILDLVLSSEGNMVEDLFVLEHLANSDHNIITWKTTCETVININFGKTFVFHKADYEKITEHF